MSNRYRTSFIIKSTVLPVEAISILNINPKTTQKFLEILGLLHDTLAALSTTIELIFPQQLIQLRIGSKYAVAKAQKL